MLFANNNGVKIHYKLEGKGKPLVLLHGFTDSLETWHEYSYVESLKDNYQLILVDLRGHGLSDRPHTPEEYTMKILTSDIIAVMDEIGVDKAHFWGYSMGGHIGFGLSKHYPERFHSFILGGITPQKIEGEMWEKIAGFHTLFSEDAEFFISAVTQRGNVLTPETEEEIRGYDFKALYAFWGADIFNEEASHLDTFEIPILLYNGEKDEWGHYPRTIEASKMYPKLKVVTFPNEGHSVFNKRDLILPHVIKFLKEISKIN